MKVICACEAATAVIGCRSFASGRAVLSNGTFVGLIKDMDAPYGTFGTRVPFLFGGEVRRRKGNVPPMKGFCMP